MKDAEIERMSEFEENHSWFVGRRKIITSMLDNSLGSASNLSILDVGCGNGSTTILLKKFGTVYGTDYSSLALKHSTERGLNRVVISTATNLPFASQSFDVITVFDVIEHMRDDVRVLTELKYLLKKDGIIFITVPAYQFLWSDHDISLSHFRRYNSKTLTECIARAGLRIIRLSYCVSFLFPLVAIYRIFNKRKSKDKPKADLIRLPSFAERMLRQILFIESKVLQKTNLPFGLSLICIAGSSSSGLEYTRG
jgi:2-polyprenyl-3-methyl-5-hydroxy-6-metoxy-1,4-benzoquinol methylase